jgi:hypothetical protein
MKPRGPLTPPSILAAWACFVLALAMPLVAIVEARIGHHGLDRLGAFLERVVLTGGPLALIGIVLTVAGARRWPRNAVTMGAIYFAGAFAILGLGVFAFIVYINY